MQWGHYLKMEMMTVFTTTNMTVENYGFRFLLKTF